MKSGSRLKIVLVTAPNLKTARDLARIALERRAVACANLVPKVESHYWWMGKLESATEILIFFKTTQRRIAALERLVRENHPYDTPEILAIQIDQGFDRYLDWLAASCASAPPRKKRG